MLNIFPNLLFLQLLAPFLLRVVLGIIFIWISYSYLFKDRAIISLQLSNRWSRFIKPLILIIGTLYLITGIFFVAGFLTQIMAIIGMLIAIDALFVKFLYKDLDKVARYNKMFYILVFIISLSLLISGAGAFAIDLPL